MADAILVSFFMGSANDLKTVQKALELMEKWQLPFRVHTLSAHRTADALDATLKKDIDDGCRVILAAAGMAAHLPGVIASRTVLPVIGIPLSSGSLQGIDALYSIVQMPAGIPVATMALDSAGAQNAVIFAAQILGGIWHDKVQTERAERAAQVLASEQKLQQHGFRSLLA